jgi:uncharacterized protein YjbI with pentapeptide repeats
MSSPPASPDSSDTLARCEHHEVCGRNEHTEGLGYCILHDPDMEKDREAFDAALAEHRDMLRERREKAKREEGDNYKPRWELREDFRWMVFARSASFREKVFQREGIDFSKAMFIGDVSFQGATFTGRCEFFSVRFCSHTSFHAADFCEPANFRDSEFEGSVRLSKSKFRSSSSFFDASFHKWVSFRNTSFSHSPVFSGSVFRGAVNFESTSFESPFVLRYASFDGPASFRHTCFTKSVELIECTFRDRVVFAGDDDDNLFSANKTESVEVDLRGVRFEEPRKVVFQNVDLAEARFLNVDVRKMEFTNVTWPPIKNGNGVYDELAVKESSDAISYAALARLYRRLKQNYEDNRDYGRGGDFHFREKEMLRLDPKTPLGHRILLTLYRITSGYGERFWAAWWLVGLIILSSLVSLSLGLEYSTLEDATWTLRWQIDDVFRSLLYGAQVAFLRPPDYLTATGPWGEVVKIVTMLLGPLFLGLFALAVRQRVRR